ncbi:glycosyltransferase family protein [Priestia megaterium]|uniref:glycosyltransferase family protein n=1 Tax=Priestia megaterium TaxID=1404 RepID=UPI0013EBD2D0|nr:glycosyltransferase family protein [Priestia megaterium]
MKTIAYYISDYGYGHATRSTAIIRELLKQNENVKIIICHSFALGFLQQSFRHEHRVAFREVATDVGYVLKENSLEPDKKLLNNNVSSYVSEFSIKLDQETQFMKEKNVSFVISDISPLGIAGAAALNIPSLGLSNFTWYTAYEGLIEEHLLSFLHAQYKQMTYHFSLACSNEPHWGIEENQSFGFYSRDIDAHEVQRIRKEIDPAGESHIIYFGLGMKVDIGTLSELPIWQSPNCKFIVSSNVNVNHPNVYRIPKAAVETQHYVATADLVLTKAGWGTVSEAVCVGVPLLITNRSSMKEDRHTIDYLVRHQLCNLIEWKELESLVVTPSLIETCRRQNINYYKNEAIHIAEEINKKIKST